MYYYRDINTIFISTESKNQKVHKIINLSLEEMKTCLKEEINNCMEQQSYDEARILIEFVSDLHKLITERKKDTLQLDPIINQLLERDLANENT